AAENNLSQQHTTESKQSGITLALSGAVGSAINSAVTTAQDAKKETNGRLQALQTTKAVLQGVQAAQGGVLANETGDPNAVGVSISLGSQKSKSESRLEQTTASGSNIAAGNNLSITATGNH
ncbi:hemagglutinin repeat-containing protein, partial [Yersinia frederiksenii]